MEFWVQRPLFETLREPTPRAERLGRVRDVSSRAHRLDHTRVTRDPAVAESHGETVRLASDLRIGLARALDRLPSEQRAQIRRRLAGTGSSAA